MSHLTKALTACLIFCLCFPALAQSNEKQKIETALTDYFTLERENFHVQFDKAIFFTNEKIWFKGYVYHRKKTIPFFNTTNIFASLIDSDGKIINTKLLYGNLGSFTGNFELDKNLKSGKYYIQVYTNWMNNFTEDESFVQELTIINENDNAGMVLGKKPSQINIAVTPEGGKILAGAANTIGINVAACGGAPVPVTTADLLDAGGKTLATVQLNKMGNGRYELPANLKVAKVKVTYNGKTFEQPMPPFEASGVNLSVNNYAVAGKTIIKMRTAPQMLTAITGKTFYLILHQDEKALIYEVAFVGSETEQTVIIPSAELFEGMITVRLVDDTMNEVSSRLIYNYPAESLKTTIGPGGYDDGYMKYSGKINFPNMNLSVAVLPEKTISIEETNDIYTSLLIAPYIKSHKKTPGKYYLGSPTKGRHFELDLFLLGQETKYAWHTIMNKPGKPVFTFDMGLDIKGKVPLNVDRKQYRVRMLSTRSYLNEYAQIDEKNEFLFKNVVVEDSTPVKFTLVRVNEKQPKDFKPDLQVSNGSSSRYSKLYRPAPLCDTETQDAAPVTDLYDAPKIYNETIELETVKIEGKRLKYANSYGNGNLTGYKIDDKVSSNLTLLQYLKNHGRFDIVDNGLDVAILGRSRTTIKGGANSPIVFIDNIQLFDFTMLRMIMMNEVEEVYINPNAIVPSVRNNQGIIKVYLRKGVRIGKTTVVENAIVKNGFETPVRFENVQYVSISDKAYENFGLVYWHPVIMTDENGNFTFEIPATQQKKVKLLIEGFSADGKLISEIKTIDAN
ncbi:MAG: hypothetical protein ACO1N9_12460 [Flavobacterium sp.]